MQTRHRIHCRDARSLEPLDADSVELVVTSPPYPMIEMWDETFTSMDPAVGTALEAGDGDEAFALMHEQLDAVWEELSRVLIDGGIACINIGDATRTIADDFQVYSNHARIIRALNDAGFVSLPLVLWRKPTNAAAKFMGSGMLPPNAYPTLEHEYILICRNGPHARSFEPGDPDRYESAFFWEERNRWFSDVWTDVTGVDQAMGNDERDRSGAYPVTIPYRLINMFSIYGDTVLDPFWGTGTSTIAAMLTARNSVGIELSQSLIDAFPERLSGIESRSRSIVNQRIEAHRAFIDEHQSSDQTFEYEASTYPFPVKTKQEREMVFRVIDSVECVDDSYRVSHSIIDDLSSI